MELPEPLWREDFHLTSIGVHLTINGFFTQATDIDSNPFTTYLFYLCNAINISI